MTAYVECKECKGDVPWYYAWVWHPTIAMHPGCAKERWDDEGGGAIGPDIRKYYQDLHDEFNMKENSK